MSQFGLIEGKKGNLHEGTWESTLWLSSKKLDAACCVGHASHYFSGSTFLNYVEYVGRGHQSKA